MLVPLSTAVPGSFSYLFCRFCSYCPRFLLTALGLRLCLLKTCKRKQSSFKDFAGMCSTKNFNSFLGVHKVKTKVVYIWIWTRDFVYKILHWICIWCMYYYFRLQLKKKIFFNTRSKNISSTYSMIYIFSICIDI